jgi:hypothetical protein
VDSLSTGCNRLLIFFLETIYSIWQLPPFYTDFIIRKMTFVASAGTGGGNNVVVVESTTLVVGVVVVVGGRHGDDDGGGGWFGFKL